MLHRSVNRPVRSKPSSRLRETRIADFDAEVEAVFIDLDEDDEGMEADVQSVPHGNDDTATEDAELLQMVRAQEFGRA